MTQKQAETAFLKTDEEMEDEGICKQCGGKGEVMLEYGEGDNFTQTYVPCECKGTDEDNYIDMSGATPGHR